MRINKIKKMMTEGKPVINGWLQVPSTASAETMSQQGWDSLTIDMQHGLVDYTNALPMLQTISANKEAKMLIKDDLTIMITKSLKTTIIPVTSILESLLKLFSI